MGLMDKLNMISNKMNSAMGNIENSQDQSIIDSRGLEGLGNINTDNSSTNLRTPGSLLIKSNTDARKLFTDMREFSSDEEYCRALINWMQSTNIGNIDTVSDDIKAAIGTNNIFVIKTLSMNYCVIPSISIDTIKSVMQQINSNINLLQNMQPVTMVCINYDIEARNIASCAGTELIGREEIFEINGAIDSADKGMPYISIGNSNSLKSILCKHLNNRYKNNQYLGDTANNIGNQFTGYINSVVDNFKRN